MVKVFVPRERGEGETRVGVTPETVKRLAKRKVEVTIEADAGRASHFLDAAYKDHGATVVSGDGVKKAWAEADIVVKVSPLVENDSVGGHEADAVGEGAIYVGFCAPHKSHDVVKKLRDRKVSALAMELVPRITRAQTMDALSSQASIAGYKAVLIAGAALDKYFPLLMTAAGTIQPARCVIMGAGVAGLQAIATAKRLGALVEVSDIREAVKEQVESLGGRFIDLPDMQEGEGVGGYAREVTPEFLKKQQAIVAEHVRHADVVITTALVPGKPAPKLVTDEMVKSMREGGVIVDMAVEQGGNCTLSKKDEDVVAHGVHIIGRSNLATSAPLDASIMYARNVAALVELFVDKEGNLKLDLEDEVIDGTLLTHAGKVHHKPTAEAMGEKPAAAAASKDEDKDDEGADDGDDADDAGQDESSPGDSAA